MHDNEFFIFSQSYAKRIYVECFMSCIFIVLDAIYIFTKLSFKLVLEARLKIIVSIKSMYSLNY